MAKTLTGVVTSDRPDKTIVVSVATRKTHPVYKKQYTDTKKFMAHDEKNEAHEGDKVIISETRPLSARKRFELTKILERAGVKHVEPEVEETETAEEKQA
ncbi:30S ribosomal protein S17 [Patescibacteria group bacterium]|nr:MAG: 30S ribosomal protein S17 [Patescibacteria group bacterium]